MSKLNEFCVGALALVQLLAQKRSNFSPDIATLLAQI